MPPRDGQFGPAVTTPQSSQRRPTPTNLLVTALGVRADDGRAAALVTELADRLHPSVILELARVIDAAKLIAVDRYATQVALTGRAVRQELHQALTVERYGEATRHG